MKSLGIELGTSRTEGRALTNCAILAPRKEKRKEGKKGGREIKEERKSSEKRQRSKTFVKRKTFTKSEGKEDTRQE